MINVDLVLDPVHNGLRFQKGFVVVFDQCSKTLKFVSSDGNMSVALNAEDVYIYLFLRNKNQTRTFFCFYLQETKSFHSRFY